MITIIKQPQNNNMNNMIYLIVGASCSGKTSFTYNSFLKGKEFTQTKDILDYCETNDTILLGKWDREGRTKGSDTINRVDIPLINSWIAKMLESNKDIVLEGDKITSRTIFNYIKELNIPCKLYWIKVEPETSYERNMSNGSTCSFKHLKAVTTKAQNIFIEYCDLFSGEVVDTNKLSREDFDLLDKNNYNLICKDDSNLF